MDATLSHMTDTTARPADLHVYLGYRDAPAAVDWLERALGFSTTMRYPDEDGGILHCELRLGDAAMLVFSDRDGYQRPPRRGETCGQGVYLSVGDEATVDAAYAAAVGAGATVIWKPESNEWGSHRCRFVDPGGIEWTVGTHRPGEPQHWDG